jgi:hypothetical protein
VKQNRLSSHQSCSILHVLKEFQAVMKLRYPVFYLILWFIRASSGESCHRKENQLVLHTQWIKFHPQAIVSKVDSSPLIYICFITIAFQPWSVSSNYVQTVHFPIHPNHTGRIGPLLFRKTEQFLLTIVKTIWLQPRLIIPRRTAYRVI